MAAVRVEPLLYPTGIAVSDLIGLVSGAVPVENLAFDPNLVSFQDGGGDADLELAIPFLAGMDEVVVEAAQLRLRGETPELELSTYSVSDASDGKGSFLDLGGPARLHRVVVDAPSTATAGLADLHLVVRIAEGLQPGPPVFADPSFPPPSPVFDRVFAGMTVSTLGSGRQLLLPGAQGSAWLLQYATGKQPTNLQPVAEKFTVQRVTVDAAATDLALVIPGPAEGDPRIPLWSQPGAFLPEVGEQEVNFTPLAQRHLAAALAAIDKASGPQTLPIPLRFTSSTGGAVRVVSKTLTAHYVVRPLRADPVTARLGGDWTPLVLRAPASRRPSDSALRLRARHSGRELNGGSPVPTLAAPQAGVRVTVDRQVAAAVAFSPLAGAPATLPLASARIHALALGPAEVVMELRGDAAGAPGPLLGAPVVKQLTPAATPPPHAPAWVEFELPPPGVPVAAPSMVWVTLRMNQGELRWFASGSGDARVSLDGGSSWGTVDPRLTSAGAPLAQLFHAIANPPPVEIQVLAGETPAGSITLARADGDRLELAGAAGLGLPGAVLTALATAGPAGDGDRAETTLRLFSRAVADLEIEELTVSYDPFASG
jgi:hypothetical protein